MAGFYSTDQEKLDRSGENDGSSNPKGGFFSTFIIRDRKKKHEVFKPNAYRQLPLTELQRRCVGIEVP
jgi:hypothetical protein